MRWFGRSVSDMDVTQASSPASSGGVPPPVGMLGFIAASVPCTETVLELAAGDGSATLPRQPVEVAIEALVLAHDVARGFPRTEFFTSPFCVRSHRIFPAENRLKLHQNLIAIHRFKLPG